MNALGTRVWLGRGDKGPMRLVGGAFFDPPLEQADLLSREPANLGPRGRHHRVGIVRDDPGDKFALVNVLRNDRPHAAVEFGGGRCWLIKPQAGLAVTAVGPVAGKAVLRQDRPDVLVERELLRLQSRS